MHEECTGSLSCAIAYRLLAKLLTSSIEGTFALQVKEKHLVFSIHVYFLFNTHSKQNMDLVLAKKIFVYATLYVR